MNTLLEIFSPGFPLRNSIFASLMVGITCPLMGVYLVLRRMVFLGVALPQISSAGVAFAFALPAWGLFAGLHDTHAERSLAVAGSLLFTLLAILWLVWIERRGRTAIEAHIGTAYALAGACGILLLVVNPHGEHGMLELLRGEVIAVTDTDLRREGATFALATGALLLFQKEFLLVSFDRDMAVTLGKRVLLWDLGLYALIGSTVSVAVLIVGPLVTFGFLLLPGLLARHWARTMRGLLLIAVVAGTGGAFGGFVLAYRLDWPVGPTDLLVMGVALGVSSGIRKLASRRG